MVEVARVLLETDYPGRDEYRTSDRNTTDEELCVVGQELVQVDTGDGHNGRDNVLILVERGYIPSVTGDRWAASRIIVKGYPRQLKQSQPADVSSGGDGEQDGGDTRRVSFPGCLNPESCDPCFSWPQESTESASPSTRGDGADGCEIDMPPVNMVLGRPDGLRNRFAAAFSR